MYYASIGMLSLIVHVIINFEALKKPQNVLQNTSQMFTRQRYRMFLFGVMLYYVTDILWGILDGAGLFVPAYIFTIAYFMSMVLSVLLWTKFVVSYLDSKGIFSKILLYSGWIIFIYEIIALIINFFIPVVFAYGEDTVYIPGQARYITLFIQMGLFLMTSVYTLIVSARLEEAAKSHHRTIGFSGIVMTIFIALQTLNPHMPFYAAGCLFATCLLHSFVYSDEAAERTREIEQGRKIAYKDPLTGVKNKLAYLEAQKSIEERIIDGKMNSFGVVVFDVNGLKRVNDTQGHDVGDEYIQGACRIICQQFKHSPVFRIGGDEFVVILEGEDYENRVQLVEIFDKRIEDNQTNGQIIISCGLDEYNSQNDSSYNDVFKRADQKMYERKKRLKDYGSKWDLLDAN